MKVLIFTALISLTLIGCTDQKSETSDAAKEVNFTELAFADQHAMLVKNLEASKAGLAAKGEYTCCVIPTCNWCIINEKHCGCAPHLQKGKGVCGSCGQSWAMGRGVLPEISAEDVKWGPGAVHEEHHEENNEEDHDD